jgi:hypothetical protein
MKTVTTSRRFRRRRDRIFRPDPVSPELNLESYFKIGVSDDYILIRGDFPIAEISPGDFSKLCREMFRRNEEALHNGK